MIDIAILDRLNAPAAEERLENLRALKRTGAGVVGHFHPKQMFYVFVKGI